MPYSGRFEGCVARETPAGIPVGALIVLDAELAHYPPARKVQSNTGPVP
jgi:hypothetical protein